MNTLPARLPDITGRAEIEVLVDTFYHEIQSDNLLGFIFDEIAHTNWITHLPKMYSIWETMIFPGSGGNPIVAHRIGPSAVRPVALPLQGHARRTAPDEPGRSPAAQNEFCSGLS